MCVDAVLRQRLDATVAGRPEGRRLRLWRFMARNRRALREAARPKPIPKKREELLHQLQKTLYERTRFAPIYDYWWASGVGPRVEEASLARIEFYPWSAPLEDVRLKKQ